jgi:hypothetical protein
MHQWLQIFARPCLSIWRIGQIGSVRQIVAKLGERNPSWALAFISRDLPLPGKSAYTAARCTARLSILAASLRGPTHFALDLPLPGKSAITALR